MIRPNFPLALCALAAMTSFLLPAAAMAQEKTPSYIDLYYVALADLEVNDFKFDNGDGYGGKGVFVLGNLFIAGEYQNLEYDPFDRDNGVFGGETRVEVEVESYRGGLGVYLGDSPFYVMGEYIGFESEFSTTGEEDDEEGLGEDIDGDGYGVHAGIDGTFGGAIGLHAQAGYVDVGDAGDGFEWLAGGSFSFTPGIGVFADYRDSDLEKDVDLSLQNVRVGLRISFS
ncbi:MAG: hypothetical protein ACT4QA_22440 [Panacagrimonas sp.]